MSVSRIKNRIRVTALREVNTGYKWNSLAKCSQKSRKYVITSKNVQIFLSREYNVMMIVKTETTYFLLCVVLCKYWRFWDEYRCPIHQQWKSLIVSFSEKHSTSAWFSSYFIHNLLVLWWLFIILFHMVSCIHCNYRLQRSTIYQILVFRFASMRLLQIILLLL